MTVQLEENTSCLKLVGRIQTHEGFELKEKVLAILEEGAKEVILDLAETDFLDSSVLGHIMGAHINCKKSGATLKLANVNETILEILRVTNLSTVLTIV